MVEDSIKTLMAMTQLSNIFFDLLKKEKEILNLTQIKVMFLHSQSR